MLWIQTGSELPAIEQIGHLSATGLLGVGVVVLWRALQSSMKANELLLREMMTHVEKLNDIPEAFSRLERAVLERPKS